MRRVIGWAALLGVAMPGAPPASAQNALQNPGFESGGLAPWFQDRDQGGSEDWNATFADARSGSFSATDVGPKELRQDFVPIPVEDLESVTFWARHPSQPTAPVGVFLFYADGSDSNPVLFTSSTAWELFDVTPFLVPGRELTALGISGFETVPSPGPDDRTLVDDASVLLRRSGLPLAIPDADASGAASTVDVPWDFPIVDLDVVVEIDHTWVGDLVVTLESPLGQRVTLLDRPGVPGASSVGCADDNLRVRFDDAAAIDPEDLCSESNQSPWLEGAARPVGALSDLNGESTLGTWTLEVSDRETADVGFLRDWRLAFVPEPTGTALRLAAVAALAAIAARRRRA